MEKLGVINLALSSSLRGPWGSGMFGMGKSLRAQGASGGLFGVCQGGSCARGRLQALMAPRAGQSPSFVTISRLPADEKVCSVTQSQPTPRSFSLLLPPTLSVRDRVRVVASVHSMLLLLSLTFFICKMGCVILSCHLRGRIMK